MGLMLIKKPGIDSDRFIHITKTARKLYDNDSPNKFAAVILRKNHKSIFSIRSIANSDTMGSFLDLLHINKEDLCVVCLNSILDGEKPKDIDHMSPILLDVSPSSMAFSADGLNGNSFVASSDSFIKYNYAAQSTEIMQYVTNYLFSLNGKGLFNNGYYKQVVENDRNLHDGLKIVYGNINGFYIHNEDLFYLLNGVLISKKINALRITKYFREKESFKPQSVENTRNSNKWFLKKRTYTDFKDSIFFHKNEVGKTFLEKEKFVISNINNYTVVALTSILTNKTVNIFFPQLIVDYTAYWIKRLHNE